MNLLEFKYPVNITYIIFPIACLVLFILGWRKKEKILKLLKISTKKKLRALRIAAVSLGLMLMFFALLGPQSFEGITEVERTGLDIYVLVDTSKSMLTEDIKPNRISRAQKIIESIIDNLDGDRIGFIPYSSSAYIQMPLTDDYQLARMFLKVIDTDMIGGGGTNAGSAIRLAAESFTQTSSADKVIIVLSDGEEYNTDSVDVLSSIENEHLKVFTIGIGSEKGGLIPVYDAEGSNRIDYKKDSSGEFVMSRLDEETLKSLAASGKGVYYQASTSGSEINSLLQDISALKRDTFKTEKIRRFEQLYQYFLGAGVLLFLLGYLVPEGRNF